MAELKKRKKTIFFIIHFILKAFYRCFMNLYDSNYILPA